MLPPTFTNAVGDPGSHWLRVEKPLGLLDTLFHAFRFLAPLLEANRPFSEARQAVVSSTPALHERELAKLEVLADALAAALRARGVGEQPAVLAARTGMAAFAHATIGWLNTPELGLAERLDLVLRDLRLLFDAGAG